MIGVLIVPTGLGATIGGHAGDANPVAKLIGVCCDKLITHPNVVNASDINEMPENTLYVEGSILDRFLEGKIQLREVRQNRILVVVNRPATGDTINAVSAARVTIGIDAQIIELETPFRMIARMDQGRATGDVYGADEVVRQISKYDFDALAIHTPIEVSREIALDYYRKGGVNPWGGVEAKASRMIADKINKPVAHAPLENVEPDDKELYHIFKETIDPRIAPEAVSLCYLHCVLKGLNKAPRIGKGISVYEIDFMISPWGCIGRPHMACIEAEIPIIVVQENEVVLNDLTPKGKRKNFIYVENYLEAAGIIMTMKAGISRQSVRSPIDKTRILNGSLE